nr:immunoglobulin heavy chain junction region [Homo sapiens]
LCERAGGLL